MNQARDIIEARVPSTNHTRPSTMMLVRIAVLSAIAAVAAADYGDPRKGACATGDSEFRKLVPACRSRIHPPRHSRSQHGAIGPLPV